MDNERPDTRAQSGRDAGEIEHEPVVAPASEGEPGTGLSDDLDKVAWPGPPGSLLRYLSLQEELGPISGF